MSFCQTCQSLPFPDIFKLWKVDRSIYDRFEWFQLSQSVRSKDPFVRWHPNISQLQRGSENCPLCLAIWNGIKNSYHYHANCRDQDERTLWLELKVGYPLWIVYIGEGEPEERLSGNYTIRMTPDQAVQDTNPFVEVIEDSLHPLVLGKARNWIQTCNEQHPDCFHELNTETKLPTRLLDLGSLPSGNDFDCIQGDPRTLLEDTSFNLVETSPGEKGQYIALSYCWGQGLAYKTMTDNLQKHKSNGGIRYAQLPKTLQDAVFLTRYLGIRYIWADCLCIIQDDKADWEYEASRMADVYTNGYLTIAAARASHCNEGFLNPRKSKNRDVVPLPTEKGPCNLYFYYDDLFMSPGSIDSVVAPAMSIRKEEPLLSRVWCAQERVLANRTLHMGSQQMYWECSRHFQTEDGMTDDIESCPQYNLSQIADGLKNVVDISKVKSTRPVYNSNEERWALNKEWRPWLRLIEEYTSRNMTVASDKLPALSGVMSALQKLTGDTCLAGIWKSWFTRGLLWRIQVPEYDNYVFHPKTASRPDFWRAPSWSFAALEGVVRYHLLQYDYYEEACAELLDCSVVPKGKNPLGELASGFAVMKGPVVQLFDAAEQQSSVGRECRMRMSGNRLAEARVYYDVEYYGACDVLLITPRAGIAIMPDKVDSSKYVRVGAVSVYRVLDPSMENYRNPDSITTIPLSSFTAVDWPEPTVITLV